MFVFLRDLERNIFVLSMNILSNTAYKIIFQLFKFICSIYFMFVFLRDLERNIFMQRYEQWFMQWFEQWFMQRYEQWFMQWFEQWFCIIRTDNPDR